MPSTDVIRLTLTLKISTTQVVKTSVTVNNSPVQEFIHKDDRAPPTYVSFLFSSYFGTQRVTVVSLVLFEEKRDDGLPLEFQTLSSCIIIVLFARFMMMVKTCSWSWS